MRTTVRMLNNDGHIVTSKRLGVEGQVGRISERMRRQGRHDDSKVYVDFKYKGRSRT